jgi:hypothetical protein
MCSRSWQRLVLVSAARGSIEAAISSMKVQQDLAAPGMVEKFMGQEKGQI